MEDVANSSKSCNISVIEDEKDKVKDFVYKHFRDVSDGPLYGDPEECPVKEKRTRRGKQTLKVPQRAVFSGKVLSFGCSLCKNNFTFSPNDLVKHYRIAHQGSLPTFPCDLCDFTTNEFSLLQRHRIEHRNTLVTCELCNNNEQYSLLLLTRHYMMCHSVNGQFRCDWCHFTTADAGTFVQHIHHHNESHWKCSKCKHISLNEDDHKKHMKAHAGNFPFTCQLCGYGAAKKESLKCHTTTAHRTYRRNILKTLEEPSSTPTSDNLKIVFRKGSEERTPRMNHLPGAAVNLNGKLLKSELLLEEAGLTQEGGVGKKDGKGSDQSTSVPQESEKQLSPNSNGLTVLMLKNKISLPPHCTTKVMGFKLVDGKKHLVLKVIPAGKQDQPQPDGAGPLEVKPVIERSNGERPERTSQMDQDEIMAVKVKIEEEETSVSSFLSPPHTAEELTPVRFHSHTNSHNDSEILNDPNQSDQVSGLSRSRSVLGVCEEPQTAGSGSEDKKRKATALFPLEEDDGTDPHRTCSVSNQKVFSFHNYSKETFSTLLNTIHSPESCSEHSEDEKPLSESFSLTLAESPERPEEDDVVVDDISTEETMDSVLQDLNIIKVEEDDCIPISAKPPESCEGVQQRVGGSVGSAEPPKQTKTTLRILQLPDGNQLLRDIGRPLQVKAAPAGFKLLTNSSNPQINVSSLNTVSDRSRLVGVPTVAPSPAGRGHTLISALNSSNHFLINRPGMKAPVILTPQNKASDKTPKAPQMCYLVQRTAPSIRLAGTPLSLNSRPVLAMNPAEKASTLPAGRQAFLLRYVSPQKTGVVLNNQEAKSKPTTNQSSDTSPNKVILKIVSPSSSLLSSGAPPSTNKPLFLTTRPQTKCFLVASNKAAASHSGTNKLISFQNSVKSCNASPPRHEQEEELSSAPPPLRPPSQRKRRRKALFDELPAAQKIRKLSSKVQTEKEDEWKPVPKDEERTLRLAPFSPDQQVKCPRRYQPVVVLNHPDADIPEVVNIMKVVSKHKGAINKVSLCPKTVQLLSDLTPWGTRPIQNLVRERFLLKLRLRKKNKKKYQVVKSFRKRGGATRFSCWFCGRIFHNQEDWVGHGQRHLMEATRDWNKLFS